LRVFVNPSSDYGNGLCDIASTVKMAKRAKTAGMQVMLTLHYSDSWADPSKQTLPAAWSTYSVTQLETAVYNHTKDVMNALAAEGINPVLVQTGNETNDGMLWNNGKASQNMGNYARFVSAGYKAVKEVSPETQTVVHLSNGFDASLYSWNIGGLVSNNAKFDIIGMSAYPEYAPNTTVNDWQAFNKKVYDNAVALVKAYKKPIIISETGMQYTAEKQCQSMIADMLTKMRTLENKMGMGILYWEPQAGPGYNRGYNLGAWGSDGRPTQALKGFLESGTEAKIFVKQKSQLSHYSSILHIVNNTDRFFLANEYAGTKVSVYSTSGRMIYSGLLTNQLQYLTPDNAYILKVR
jgi:arabinogalactan endo-1,4-beta-galactosidase